MPEAHHLRYDAVRLIYRFGLASFRLTCPNLYPTTDVYLTYVLTYPDTTGSILTESLIQTHVFFVYNTLEMYLYESMRVAKPLYPRFLKPRRGPLYI